jgi:hypothetical protein
MLIDRSHRAWAFASALILAAALIAYVPYAMQPIALDGGSALGLAYGIVGFGFMMAAALLSIRKKFPIWRIGRAQAWMRGHLWLGVLSLPLIVLHSGLHFGRGLTSWLMWLLVFVWTSGLLGAWAQHVLPRRLLRGVPMETIYDQIGRVRAQLVDEADLLVADATGRLDVSTPVPAAAGSAPPAVSTEGATALATVMRPVQPSADDTGPLRAFYMGEMRPFLERPARRHPLADAAAASALFGKLRALVPISLAAAISDLEHVCQEERQLLRQERLHRVLHGWLLIHVPLSFTLIALAVVHIIMSLRY